jgi:hypothetical protein
MDVTMKVEVGEIRNGFVGARRGDLGAPRQPSEGLNDFDVQEVRRMEFVTVLEEAGFDSDAEFRLQEQLQQRRCVNDDHADSRSSRMTTAAGVFRVTRLRAWSLASISSRVGRAANRSISASR